MGRLVPALMGFLTIPVFTRTLGTEGYGTFSLLMGSISLLIVLSTGWLESTAVRFTGTPDALSSKNYSKSYLYLFFGTVLLAVVLALLCFFIFFQSADNDNQKYLIPAILGFIGIALFRPSVNYYRALELPQYYMITMISYSVSRFAFAVGLLMLISTTTDMIFYAYFITGVLVALFPLRKLIQHARQAPLKISMLKEMVGYGLPYIPLLTAAWVFSMFNRFALDATIGRETVGVYAAAYNITDQSIGFLYMAIMMAIFPRLVKVYETGSKSETEQLMTHGMSLYAIIIIPAIFGFAMLGRELLPLLTSSDYLSAATIIPALALNTGIVGFNQYLSKPYELAKNTTKLMTIFVFGSILNIAIVFPMIQYLGLLGAVYSNTLSLLLIGLLLFFRNNNSISVQIPWLIGAKVLFGVTVMVLCLYLSNMLFPSGLGWIILKITVGIISYGSVIGILGLKQVVIG